MSRQEHREGSVSWSPDYKSEEPRPTAMVVRELRRLGQLKDIAEMAERYMFAVEGWLPNADFFREKLFREIRKWRKHGT